MAARARRRDIAACSAAMPRCHCRCEQSFAPMTAFGSLAWVRAVGLSRKALGVMSARHVIAFALLGLSVAACTADSGPKEAGGTAVGAVTGGVIGAAVGGLFGNRIGAAMDDEDRRRAYAAQMQALETGPSGAPVAWRNPDSGRYGNVVPGPAYQASGATCRQYTHTVYIDGTPQSARGTACRNPDGTWTTLN